ncbi:MAG: single-stranded DNA-binding protein [Bacteroidia bacterium]|jgi:single-strand DNA-binding protein|nr:single-stranded DNA-binding protein [Bacteroidia bacterium]|tara:strand:- start:10385 stop:10750 length:366 start_codon:yes stop_codon:yes gene_type:complete
MNALKNKVQLIGNLGMNPEVKELDGGRKVAKFTLATNEVYKNQKGEKVQDTQWHNIVAWGKTASLMEELLSKGKEVLVEGKLTNRSWDDKEGNKRYITEIVTSDFLILTPKTQSKKEEIPF